MDAVGLGLAVLTAFKEIYLVSKFIYKTVVSAKNSKSERDNLDEEFWGELLFLRSFGQLFLRDRNIVEDEDLNKAWIAQIHSVLERLRLTCNDYAKIAAEQDKEYQKYSPYLNASTSNSQVIEFSLSIEHTSLETAQGLVPVSKTSKSAFKWFAQKVVIGVDAWKWALFDRRKFEQLLRKFQKHLGKLKEIIPLALALDSRHRDSGSLEQLVNNEDAARLGLVPHIRLRQIVLDLTVEDMDLNLSDATLEGPLESSTLALAKLFRDNSGNSPVENILLEYKEYETDNQEFRPSPATMDRIEQLANLLSSSGDYNLRTLKFRGYVIEKQQHRYAFLFHFPRGSVQKVPKSLHDIIQSSNSNARFSLSQRFRVARTVAQTIAAFHSVGWVHKSVRSHSIMFFEYEDTNLPTDHDPYLVNFEYSRPETADTQFTYDNYYEKNLYRHPDRQGVPTIRFSKLHDIYALGVVLLEIGLWQTATSFYQEACSRLKANVVIKPRGMQNIFIEIARRRLAHHMGDAYMKAVIQCLSGEFQDKVANLDFPMRFRQEIVESIDVRKLA